ncbi:MAG: MerR family transcriptional regulator [Deltaproteobacteria bacterium]|uniref:helix-turn-helix domain-containing protein n=1 Tax=Desulfobacula sp. TaxID=2593537 RepID=UPI0019BFFCE7|nr:MerR family transcriptional regulator [Candidatus Desulfobacula maris]MBL6995091.1 MerR family transcriptional regulator [Desulfobacula sp.]
MTDFKSKKYSIGQAANLCGITVKQLRNWEDRNYIPTATRIICGQRAFRYFSESDLGIIRKIKQYLNAGFTLLAAAKKAAEDQERKEVFKNDK